VVNYTQLYTDNSEKSVRSWEDANNLLSSYDTTPMLVPFVQVFSTAWLLHCGTDQAARWQCT